MLRWAGLVVLAFLPSVGAIEPSPPGVEELCVITLRPDADWERVEVRVDEVYNQSAKDRLAEDVDTDEDRMITLGEVSAYENSTHIEYGRFEYLGVKALALDYVDPSRAEFHTDLTRVEGPVSERGDWLITEVREYFFDPPVSPAPSKHLVEGGWDAGISRVAIEVVVFEAPPNWNVWAVDGKEYGKPSVAIPKFNFQQPFTVEFRQVLVASEGGIIPGVPLSWAVLTIAACLAVRSTRSP